MPIRAAVAPSPSLVALTPTATKTGTYTAASGEIVCYNASGGTFSVRAPASPSDRAWFTIKEVAGSSTAITVDGNGANIDRAATMQFGVADGSITLQYSSTHSRWLVL
jgi:hypothetical protein